jgi:hypothetical protein
VKLRVVVNEFTLKSAYIFEILIINLKEMNNRFGSVSAAGTNPRPLSRG